MKAVRRIAIYKSQSLFLAFIVGLATSLALSGVSMALPKTTTVYNQCACLCDGPTGGDIDTYNNTGGYDCGVYNSQTCSYTDPKTGGVNTGKTKFCGPYKPGGTRAALMLPRTGTSAAVMSRGVEGQDQPTVDAMPKELVPMSGTGEVMMSCNCDNGRGSCSVTSKDGKTSTCHKGENDTCAGACSYPKGTISGARTTP